MAANTYNQLNQRSISIDLDDELFRPYLDTNDLPTEDVTLRLQPFLRGLISRRQDIKRSVDVLSISLTALRRIYHDLDGVITNYESLLSPIRRLSDDVLGEIFLHTLPTTRNAIPIPSEFPVLLTLVCRKWRTVAERTPRLWSKLHVVLPYDLSTVYPDEEDGEDDEDSENVQRGRSYISAVRRMFRLSGSVPLSLSITSSRQYASAEKMTSLARDLVLPLIQQSSRWREIDIACGYHVIQFLNENVEASSTGQLVPSLRRLRVRHITNSYAPEVPIPLLLYSCRSLRELSINLLSMASVPSIITALHNIVNWRSLTRLALHGCLGSPGWFFELFHQCNELEALLLDVADLGENIPSIYLPKLRSLYLRGGNDDHYNFCGYLEAPLLTHFTYHPTHEKGGYLNHHQPATSPLRQFLARCGRIQSLTMYPRRINENDLLAIFETVPGITALTLDYSEITVGSLHGGWNFPQEVGTQLNSFLLLGSDTNTGSASNTSFHPLLPNLQSFSLLCFSAPPEGVELIFAFCKSRLLRSPSGSTPGVYPPFASLDHIRMTLSKRKGTIDIDDDLALYAESIGRKVGEDLTLDINCWWGDRDTIGWTPPKLFNPRADLNYMTDRTWPDMDA